MRVVSTADRTLICPKCGRLFSGRGVALYKKWILDLPCTADDPHTGPGKWVKTEHRNIFCVTCGAEGAKE